MLWEDLTPLDNQEILPEKWYTACHEWYRNSYFSKGDCVGCVWPKGHEGPHVMWSFEQVWVWYGPYKPQIPNWTRKLSE